MIRAVCRCGHVHNLADRLGGKFLRCPSCGGSVSIPDAPPREDEGDTPAPDRSPLEMDSRFMKSRPMNAPAPAPGAALAGGAAASAPIECPCCGARYGADAVFCAKCAVVLATGEPVAGLVPGGASVPRPRRRNEFPWQRALVIVALITLLAVIVALVFRAR